METVSNRGGFLSAYASDLSEQWGEIPARKSQVWVQSPGTVSMGELMLRAADATGDPEYLRMAEKIAGALVYGQRPEGGWHYFIDFDPWGIPEYYDQVASRCWGWEEFYHYGDNSTFDDDVHAGATRLPDVPISYDARPALARAARQGARVSSWRPSFRTGAGPSVFRSATTIRPITRSTTG